jgi:myosin heavy subunit
MSIFNKKRCLKPNHEKASNQFDEELISEQLRYNGIVDIAYIRNQGWPFRMTFEDFIAKYNTFLYTLNICSTKS